MSKWILTASAAVIALAAPSLADPGGNKGKGNGGQQQQQAPKAAKPDRGGGGGGGGQQARMDRGGGQPMKMERRGGGGGEMRMVQAPARGPDKVKVRGNDRAEVKVRGNDRVEVKARGNDRVEVADRGRGAQSVRIDNDRRIDVRSDNRGFAMFDNDRDRGLIDGCPPGLAKKGNGCLPPGQAKKLIGTSLPLALQASVLDGPYAQWYQDNDNYFYRNDGDYIYRVNRDGGLIDALFPTYDRDYYYYPVGMNYPVDYNYYNVPMQYQSFYPDSDDYLYRYGDGAIYQVNPQTNAIQSIVALLAGDLGVGQRMPLDYGVYNVPLAYRDRYYDTPQAMYRYNDGYIYQADPTTQLITAVISALV